jgi:alpha-L-fucosidase
MARPVPSPAQLAWQRDELALFLHFGVNTFTDREWGDGTENPAIFAPTALGREAMVCGRRKRADFAC